MLADCAGQVQFQRLVTQSLQARLHRGLAGQDAAHLAAAAVAGNHRLQQEQHAATFGIERLAASAWARRLDRVRCAACSAGRCNSG
jgi:hypothetical protein